MDIMKKTKKPVGKPPVLILGGVQNSLSIARSLGRMGVRVYLSVKQGGNALYSKFVFKSFPVYNGKDVQEFWKDLLLTGKTPSLQGSVIFPCNDDAVEFLALNRKELKDLYILDDSVPEIHLAMLNKKKTLQLAKTAKVPVPNFWEIEKLEDLKSIEGELKFPVIIKPVNSHLFQKVFPGRKYFSAKDLEDLYRISRQVLENDLKFMVAELIPGPDKLLGSYYTYMDSKGTPIFHFTKKIIRRFPKNEGLASYQITEWDEEIADMGLKFFKGINFRGLGNIEFKRDLRDNQLKVIECNPRFTAAQEMFVRSGLDISVIIYNHLVGAPFSIPNSYKQHLRFWWPEEDFRAYLQLRKKGEITLWSWIGSILHRQVFPYFQWTDPLPSWIPFAVRLKEALKKRISWRKNEF